MFEKIPFTIEIKGKEYKGFLDTNDNSTPPKVFFVIIDNYVVGNLLCREDWTFQQAGEHLPKLTLAEQNEIGKYLGNIAVEAYE